MKTKKLAICFYGQVRYIEGFNLFYKYFKDTNTDLDIDFFISTWDDFDISKINLTFKESNFVSPDESGLDLLGGHTPLMAYHLKKVLELKLQEEKKSEMQYDVVLTIRPDIVFDTVKMVSNILGFASIQHSVPTVSLHNGIVIEEGTYKLDEDYMFLMNSKGADVHSEMYDFFFTNEEYKSKNWNYREGGHWIHPHYFLHKNFNVVILRIPALIIRPVRDLEILKEHYSTSDLIFKLVKNLQNYEVDMKTFKNRVII
tara:strand:- start:2242 stop:3012 length:771 start_codon:yes stop_codon:yes gene_type:complete